MNLEQIKKAIEEGKKVYWGNRAYEVIKDSVGQYLVYCSLNEYCFGLTHVDGVTLSERESSFFVMAH